MIFSYEEIAHDTLGIKHATRFNSERLLAKKERSAIFLANPLVDIFFIQYQNQLQENDKCAN